MADFGCGVNRVNHLISSLLKKFVFLLNFDFDPVGRVNVTVLLNFVVADLQENESKLSNTQFKNNFVFLIFNSLGNIALAHEAQCVH